MLDTIFQDYLLFLLVFLRFTGAFFFNPLLGRRNIPVNIRAGLALLCALAVVGTLNGGTLHIDGWMELVLAGVKELLIGLVAGYVLNLLLSVAVISGELIDLQLGVSMSKIYDPQSNISMPLSATLLNLMLVLTFFLSNGHLTLIRVMALSFRVLPPGTALLGMEFGRYLAQLVGLVLVLGLKIALPVIALEMLGEFGMGVLMRSAPQMNIFSVGLQIRVLLGLGLMLALVPVFARVMDNLTGLFFEKLDFALQMMS